MSYFISSGEISSGIILRNASLTVAGTVQETAFSGGKLYISSGGIAILTRIFSGSIHVSSGGTAIGTTVQEGSIQNVLFGGKASTTIIESRGSMFVSGGGTAANTTIEKEGTMVLFPDSIAEDTVIDGSGIFKVSSGGTARGLTVSSDGRVNVFSGGKLTGRINLDRACVICFEAGAVVDFDLTEAVPTSIAFANDLSVLSGNPSYRVTVDPARQAKGIYLLAENATFAPTITVMGADGAELGTLNLEETITISETEYTLKLSDNVLSLQIGGDPSSVNTSGLVIEEGTREVGANDLFSETQILSGGKLLVASGGVAEGITIEADGMIEVLSGGTATGIHAASGAHLEFVVAGNTWIAGSYAGSEFEIRDGGVSGYVIDVGSLNVLDGGTADGITVNPGGSLHVAFGGTATDVAWTPCEGRVVVEEGAVATYADEYSGIYYGSDNHLVSRAESMENLTLGPDETVYVMSGGALNGAEINAGATLHVSSGGTANNIVWTPGEGDVIVEDGASATFADKYSGVYYGSDGQPASHEIMTESLILESASAYVMDRGTATRTSIGAGGSMAVSSGGVAFTAGVSSGGRLTVGFSGLASGVTIADQGEIRVGSGGYALSVEVSNGGSAGIGSGGMAIAAAIGRGGSMIVNTDGVMTGLAVVNGGSAKIAGSLYVGQISNEGCLDILSGGSASSVMVNEYGKLAVNGGFATSTTVSGNNALATVLNGGLLEGTTVTSGGRVEVDANGAADGAVIESGGRIDVNSFGAANAVTIETGGTMQIDGGRISDITVLSGGSLTATSDITLTGRLFCHGKSVISMTEGTTLNLDLSQCSPDASTRITNLARVKGSPMLSITVNAAEQEEGIYLLAGAASSFDQTITVINTDGKELGTISLEKSITVSDTSYSLLNTESALSLKIGDGPNPPAYTSIGVLLESSTKSTTIPSGVIFKDTVIQSGGTLILEGGSAEDTLVERGGWLLISSGGTLSRTTFMADAGVYVASDVIVKDIVFNENGTLDVQPGGVVNKAAFKSEGDFWVSSGGTATDIALDAGTLFVLKVTSDTYVTGSSPEAEFRMENGVLSNCSKDRLFLFVESDGTVCDTTLGSGSFLRVSSGGVAINTTVRSSATIHISSGGILRGATVIESGATVSAFSGSIIDFDLASIRPGAQDQIADLSLLKGTPVYTLTVSGMEENGVYYLAKEIRKKMYVVNKQDDVLYTLSSGTFRVGNVSYSLTNHDSIWSVTVSRPDSDSIPPTVVDATADITEMTGENVVVTAEFADNVEVGAALYRIGRTGRWNQYDGGVTVFENSTVYFKAVDTAGNESEIVSYEVSNIDSTIPISGVILTSQTRMVSSGRELMSAAVQKDGAMIVSGGRVNSTTVKASGSMAVLNGGTAKDTIVSGMSGTMVVFTGGTADGTTVDLNANMTVFSGGTATDTTVNSAGGMVILSGGTARDATVNAYGSMFISSGGILTGRMTFETGAMVSAYAGAIIEFDLASASGEADALLNKLSLIKANGALFTVSAGPSPLAGEYVLANGAEGFDGTITVVNPSGVGLGTLTVDGTTSIDGNDYSLSVVDDSLILTIAAGAVVSEFSGSLSGETRGITSGASAVDMVVDKGGCLNVIGGGSATNVSVDYGSMTVLSGGSADGIVVGPNGRLVVSSGGTATNVDWDPRRAYTANGYGDGYVQVEEGAYVTFANDCSGVYSNGGHTQIVSGRNLNGSFFVMSGGIVCDAALRQLSEMFIFSGGVASRVSLGDINERYYSRASMTVFSGGLAESTNLYYMNYMFVSSGGSANHTTVMNYYGYNNESKELVVFAGGVANNTTVDFNGDMTVSSGGTALNTILSNEFGGDSFAGGRLVVSSGGIASNITVRAGGELSVLSGGTMTGRMIFEEGARFGRMSSAFINFDLTQTSAGALPLMNDYSAIERISKSILYTLTVDSDPATGTNTYALADGVAQFNTTITVVGRDGEEFGKLAVGQTLKIGNAYYTLKLVPFKSRLAVTVVVPDMVEPTVGSITVSTTEATNQDVVVTAEFADEFELKSSLYRIGENGRWTAYADGVTVTENATVFFKAVDTEGNESEIAFYKVTNIDKEPPAIMLAGDNATPLYASTLSASTEDGVDIFYSTDNATWMKYEGEIPVTENGIYYFMATDALGNVGTAEYAFRNIMPETDVVPQTQTWEQDGEAGQYIVEYSADNFEHVIRLEVASNSLDSFQMPAGTYQWRVKAEADDEWSVAETIVSEEESAAPSIVLSNEDGSNDLFFASPSGTWSRFYYARNTGSVNDWTGTDEIIAASGRGRIQNLFFGSADPNVLCLTDADNGDAIFVDDIYTVSPEDFAKEMARLYRIQEIRAGAGDDIVDMTSPRFEYIGDGQTIRGGDGDDVIWANRGDNRLFGDAGNDRIVGASGDDVLVGGIGDDSMHGGGGSDVFTFCENWGVDTVEQLADGSVTLWFAAGDDSHWNPETLTYTDGENSVSVSGVTAEQVALRFGDDGSAQYISLSGMGAFEEFTSQRIFEESGKGILASL